MRFYLTKFQPHARCWLNVHHRRLGLKVFVRVEDFEHDLGLDTKGGGSFHVAPMRTHFYDACGNTSTGRVLWSDLGGSAEKKTQPTPVFIHSLDTYTPPPALIYPQPVPTPLGFPPATDLALAPLPA